jgi:uncharacterized YccA/Bax inhibitor family protein
MAIGSNPLLNEKTFANERWGGIMADLQKAEGKAISTTMTTQGVVVKSSVLFVLCVMSAVVNWVLAGKNDTAGIATLLGIGGAVLGLVISLVLCFKQNFAAFLSPIYAIGQGLLLGWISLVIAKSGPKGMDTGIVINAVLLTFGCFAGCLVAYAMGLVRIGRTAAAAITIGCVGLMLTYAASWILPMFGVTGMQAIHEGGPIGLVVSGIAIVLAVLSLIMSIQFVDEGVRGGAPKYMEWYAAFGLLSTLVWLYIEILRLLNKLRNN